MKHLLFTIKTWGVATLSLTNDQGSSWPTAGLLQSAKAAHDFLPYPPFSRAPARGGTGRRGRDSQKLGCPPGGGVTELRTGIPAPRRGPRAPRTPLTLPAGRQGAGPGAGRGLETPPRPSSAHLRRQPADTSWLPPPPPLPSRSRAGSGSASRRCHGEPRFAGRLRVGLHRRAPRQSAQGDPG